MINRVQLRNIILICVSFAVDIDLLNELAPTITDEMQASILFCVINAPNAFNLLLAGFELAVNKQASDKTRAHVFNVLNAVVDQVHAFVYKLLPEENKLPLIDILKENASQLLKSALTRGSAKLRKLQFRLIHLLCVYFGKDYTCQIIHCLLNSLKTDRTKLTEATPVQIHPVLTSFLKMLKLAFGSELNKYFITVVEIDQPKNLNFWINLLSILEVDEGSEMAIDIVDEHFIDLFQQEHYRKELLYFVLKVIYCCVEKFPKQIAKPKQVLCWTFVRCYVDLVDEQERTMSHTEIIMQILNLLQKTMSTLARKQITNQHILCRAFLDAIVTDKPNAFSGDTRVSNIPNVSLKEENIKFGGMQSAYKFRKMPLNNSRELKARTSHHQPITGISAQLLLDGLKSCVVDMPAFASLLVECITPDCMFNDLPWPDEDFLKVTIERDLHIARIFDNQPILWDFCELVATTGFLHQCSVLVR